MPSVSFIVPTIGRPSLNQTLESIQPKKGDEVIVIGNIKGIGSMLHGHPACGIRYIEHAPGGDWGHTERNTALQHCRGQYIAHIDDDDVYAPGTRDLMEDAMTKTPGRPVLFRMRFPNGITLWDSPILQCGNVGTPMFLHPNRPTMFGTWGSFVGGDCHFLETSKWKASDYVWRPEIIAHLGHNV